MNPSQTVRDQCVSKFHRSPNHNRPSTPPIVPAVVYEMDSPDAADRILSGDQAGYAYQRDGHPNASWLSEHCRQLHQADFAFVTSSGMSALALVVLNLLQPGHEVLLSSRLYGKTVSLVKELDRWGISHRTVDVSDLTATAKAMTDNTQLVIVETISNPTMRVADVQAIGELAHQQNAKLLVDNTFASPAIFRPLEFGADFVWESLTKIMNGHGDVLMGMLAGRGDGQLLSQTLSTWGMTASPFDCWLCERGLGTLYARVKMASESALAIARWLADQTQVKQVSYPGLVEHPDHKIAQEQFGGSGQAMFGHMLMFQVEGGREAAAKVILAMPEIPFCPSLGEMTTTQSHPTSTSHRGQNADDLAAIGIDGGTIRLSVGLESSQFVIEALSRGLKSLDF
ncbi:MAG: aminotransferase class V-fold PLP-dependent enzyme [Pirellulaceae bacterium]